MHGVQDLGELVKSSRAGGGVLPLASNDPVEFLNVVHAKFIKELLVLQAIHWNWRNKERKQSELPQTWKEEESHSKSEGVVSAEHEALPVCSLQPGSDEGRTQALTNTEEEQSLHAEKLLGCDLKPPKLL